MTEYLLTLYVAGRTARSQRAFDNLHRLCERELAGRYELTIVDVLERPQLAEDAKVLATPALLRSGGGSPGRLVGDLSDTARVLDWLAVGDSHFNTPKDPPT